MRSKAGPEASRASTIGLKGGTTGGQGEPRTTKLRTWGARVACGMWAFRGRSGCRGQQDNMSASLWLARASWTSWSAAALMRRISSPACDLFRCHFGLGVRACRVETISLQLAPSPASAASGEGALYLFGGKRFCHSSSKIKELLFPPVASLRIGAWALMAVRTGG